MLQNERETERFSFEKKPTQRYRELLILLLEFCGSVGVHFELQSYRVGSDVFDERNNTGEMRGGETYWRCVVAFIFILGSGGVRFLGIPADDSNRKRKLCEPTSCTDKTKMTQSFGSANRTESDKYGVL